MTYSSCQNKGPVIRRVKQNYIRDILKVPLNFLMFKDAVIIKNWDCFKKINNVKTNYL